MKPHDDGRALDGALRRSLASRGAVVGNDCPDADVLAAYYEHSLDATETERLDAHFSDCARCREQLAALVRSELPRNDRVARHSWIWHWRWFAPVVVAATIVVLWVGIRARNAARVAEPQIVAQNRAPVNEPVTELAPAPQQSTIQRSQPAQATPTPEPKALARPAPNLTTEVPGGREKQDEILRQAQEMRGAASGAPAARRIIAPPPQARAQAMRVPLQSRDVAPSPPTDKESPAGNGAANANATSPAPQAAAVPKSSETVEVQSAANAVSTTTPTSSQTAPTQPANPNASAALEMESKTPGKKATQRNYATHSQATGAAVSGGVLGGVVSSATKTSATGPILITTPDRAIVWRILPAGGVELSNDGGSTWKPQPDAPTAMWTSGSAPSAKVLWIVGRRGALFRTTDAHTWKTITPPTMQDLIAVTAQSAKSARIAASDGTRYKTSNGGRTWKQEPASQP